MLCVLYENKKINYKKNYVSATRACYNRYNDLVAGVTL